MGSWTLRFLLSSALLGGAVVGDLEADGGWHTDHATRMVGKGSCNLEVRDSLTYSEFIYRYAYSRPVILRGFTQNEHFRALCSKQRLLQKFGNHLVRLSTANTYSYQKVDVPFKEYVEHIMKPQTLDSLGSETLYFFGDNSFTEWDSVFRTYIQPPYQLPGTKGAYSFGIAGSGTGVPFHWHGAGYSEVIYGRKRWFLYPPDKTPKFYPNRTTLSWMLDTYPYLPEMDKPLECTIHAGEDEHKLKLHWLYPIHFPSIFRESIESETATSNLYKMISTENEDVLIHGVNMNAGEHPTYLKNEMRRKEAY